MKDITKYKRLEDNAIFYTAEIQMKTYFFSSTMRMIKPLSFVRDFEIRFERVM